MSVNHTKSPESVEGRHFDDGITGKVFAAARDAGRGALVGYLPVGYPSVPGSLEAMRALCGVGPSGQKEYEGVDLVEIGMPYSDPVMDGPTIQKASTRALQRGVKVRDVFSAVEAVAGTGTAAVVMIYWNLVERYGPDAFARDLAAAGGAGLITPDLTPDEAEDWFTASDAHGLDRVFLVAPSSSDHRLIDTVTSCRGWVYATSLMGVTGARAKTSAAAPRLVERIRETVPAARVGVGLGVSNGAQAAEINGYADAAIVGSALVNPLLEADDAGRPDDLSRLRTVVAELATGVRSGSSSPAGTSV